MVILIIFNNLIFFHKIISNALPFEYLILGDNKNCDKKLLRSNLHYDGNIMICIMKIYNITYFNFYHLILIIKQTVCGIRLLVFIY